MFILGNLLQHWVSSNSCRNDKEKMGEMFLSEIEVLKKEHKSSIEGLKSMERHNRECEIERLMKKHQNHIKQVKRVERCNHECEIENLKREHENHIEHVRREERHAHDERSQARRRNNRTYHRCGYYGGNPPADSRPAERYFTREQHDARMRRQEGFRRRRLARERRETYSGDSV